MVIFYLPVHLNKPNPLLVYIRSSFCFHLYWKKERERKRYKRIQVLVKLICLHLGFSFELLRSVNFDAQEKETNQRKKTDKNQNQLKLGSVLCIHYWLCVGLKMILYGWSHLRCFFLFFFCSRVLQINIQQKEEKITRILMHDFQCAFISNNLHQLFWLSIFSCP